MSICIYSYVQVKPARGGWRKFPGLLHYRIQRRGLPIGDAAKLHSFSTLLKTSHFLAPLLSDPHLCAPHLESPQLSFHLSSLFSTLFSSSWLISPQLHSFNFVSARLKWHKCKLVQLPFPSLDPFGSFKLRSSYYQGTPTWVQLSVTLSHLLRSSYHSFLQNHRLQNRFRIMHNSYTNCSSKTGSRRQMGKTTILKHFFKGMLKRKSAAPKSRKIFCQSTSHNLHASTTLRFTNLSCKKTLVLRTQLQQRGTLTQPFHCDLLRLSCKTQ